MSLIDDLISRKDAIEVIEAVEGLCSQKIAITNCAKIWQQIKDLPSVDAVPVVHGRWITRKERPAYTVSYLIEFYDCSICGKEYVYASNYCPHCGARMDV